MDKLKDLYDRIQTFEVDSAYPSSGCTTAGNDIQGVLNIMADLVDEMRNIEAGKAKPNCAPVPGYDAVEELVRIIRYHEREQQENATIAGQRAVEYISAMDIHGVSKEWARNQAMEYMGRARTGEDTVRAMKHLLEKMLAS